MQNANSATTSPYDFIINGIGYNILNTEEAEVKVEKCLTGGEVDIPSIVKYKGLTYAVTTLGAYAFSDAGITSVKLNEGLKKIEGYCFEKCPIKSIQLPYSFTEVSNNAFSHCSTLESIELSPLTTKIGDYAFSGTAIQHIILPNSITEIGTGAFRDCQNLADIQLPKNITKIPNELFSGCLELGYSIPDNITAIGEKAFYDCYAFENIEIPASVDSIGKSAFEGCYQAKYLKIFGHLKYVGKYAFGLGIWGKNLYAKSQCTEVFSYDKLPENLEMPFVYIPRSTQGFYAPTDPQKDVLDNSVLYVPSATSALYHARQGWKDFSGIIENDELNTNCSLTTFADEGGCIVVNDIDANDNTNTFRSGSRVKVIIRPNAGFEIKSIKMSGFDIEWNKATSYVRGNFKIEKNSSIEVTFTHVSHDINGDGVVNVGDVTTLIKEIIEKQ